MLGQLLGALGTWCLGLWAPGAHRFGHAGAASPRWCLSRMPSPPCPRPVPPHGGISSISSQLPASPSLPLPQAWAGELSPQGITPSNHPKLSPRAITLSHHPELSPHPPFTLRLLDHFSPHPAPLRELGTLCCPCSHPGGGSASKAPVLNPHIVPSEHSSDRLGQERSSGPSGASTSPRMSRSCIPHRSPAQGVPGLGHPWKWHGVSSTGDGRGCSEPPPWRSRGSHTSSLPPSGEGLSPSLPTGEVGAAWSSRWGIRGSCSPKPGSSVSVLFLPG